MAQVFDEKLRQKLSEDLLDFLSRVTSLPSARVTMSPTGRTIWVTLDAGNVAGVSVRKECDAPDVVVTLTDGSEVEVADCDQYLYARVNNTDYNISDAYLEDVKLRNGVLTITLRLNNPI